MIQKSNKSVLIIEDNQPDALFIKRLLNKQISPFFNFTSDHAENLESAILKLETNEYDVVLLDLHLPDSVGMETLEKIKPFTEKPIIVTTGTNDPQWAFNVLKEGAQDYLIKEEITDSFLTKSLVYAINRKNAELQSREDQKKFKKIFMYSHNGIIIHDFEGKITNANPSALALLDSDAKSILFTNLSKVFTKDQILSEIAQLDEKNHCFFETMVTKQNGQAFPAEVSMTLFDKTENLIQCSFRDITSRKRLEEMKDQFASTVSHEMRTPLAIISGAIENLVDGIEGELQPGQKKLMTVASKNLKRLHRIINDLLDLSRLESGIANANKMDFHPDAIATEIVQSFQKIASEKNIKIHADIENHKLQAFADPDLTFQILNNLVSNAIRYAKTEVTISMSLLKASGDNHQKLQLSVKDDGCGIPASEMENLFNKYVQIGRKQGKQGYKGTGLGLAICQELTKVQNGNLWLESEVDKGSEFFFTLPAYKEEVHFWHMLQKDIVELSNRRSTVALFSISSPNNSPLTIELKELLKNKILRKIDAFYHNRQENRFFILTSNTIKEAQSVCKRIFLETKEIGLEQKIDVRFSVYPNHARDIEELIKKTNSSEPVEPKNLQKKKVLIIDDEGELVQLLVSQLNRAGFLVDVVLNGEVGLEKNETFRPDAIILDVFMEKMNGWEVCQKLRKIESSKNIPIVMATANYSDDFDIKAKEVGANQLLKKPMTGKETVTIIQKYLS